jgi:hypothetical protein
MERHYLIRLYNIVSRGSRKYLRLIKSGRKLTSRDIGAYGKRCHMKGYIAGILDGAYEKSEAMDKIRKSLRPAGEPAKQE